MLKTDLDVRLPSCFAVWGENFVAQSAAPAGGFVILGHSFSVAIAEICFLTVFASVSMPLLSYLLLSLPSLLSLPMLSTLLLSVLFFSLLLLLSLLLSSLSLLSFWRGRNGSLSDEDNDADFVEGGTDIGPALLL